MSTHHAYSNKLNLSNLHMTQREVADALNVSQQYVQQLEVNALRKFRQRFIKHYPDTWRIIQDEISRGHFGRNWWGY